MPKLTVEGLGEFEIPTGKRLVNAARQEVSSDQLHACGGNARCTTCRVEFVSGEPSKMTVAEKQLLEGPRAKRGFASGAKSSAKRICRSGSSVGSKAVAARIADRLARKNLRATCRMDDQVLTAHPT